MRHASTVAAVVTLAMAAVTPSFADRLDGENRFLCAAVQATACLLDDECIVASPSYWNIPDFIEVDLEKKLLSTTRTSEDYRVTPIKNLDRADGLIILQGSEAGRAFSFVITEATGAVSVAVARDGTTVGVFGVCTPLPEAPRSDR